MTNASDPLAAELAAIRERERLSREQGHLRSLEDTGRLLAAVEAVLELHQLMVLDGPVTVCDYCMGHPVWPCPTREAITRALTGGTDA